MVCHDVPDPLSSSPFILHFIIDYLVTATGTPGIDEVYKIISKTLETSYTILSNLQETLIMHILLSRSAPTMFASMDPASVPTRQPGSKLTAGVGARICVPPSALSLSSTSYLLALHRGPWDR